MDQTMESIDPINEWNQWIQSMNRINGSNEWIESMETNPWNRINGIGSMASNQWIESMASNKWHRINVIESMESNPWNRINGIESMASGQWNRFNGVESMESHTKCQRLDDSCEKIFTLSKWVCKKWKKWKSSTFFKTAPAIPGRLTALTTVRFVCVSVYPLFDAPWEP